MAGRRLVDLAALFNAVRGVASQHVALRSKQWSEYQRTSNLAQAIRHQTDRLTETAKAATILASRLNDEPPTWTKDVDEIRNDGLARARHEQPAQAARETTVHDVHAEQGASIATKEIDAVARDDPPDGIDINIFQNPRVARAMQNVGNSPAPARTDASHSTQFLDPISPRGEQVKSDAAHSLSQSLPSAEEDQAAQDGMSKPVNQAQGSSEMIVPRTPDDTLGRPTADEVSPKSYQLRESTVPSSRLGRLWNYTGLAAGMVGGALNESIRRASGGGSTGSYMLSAANMDRLVMKLSRMRGAALKLGQMMSFQDSKMLPSPIHEVLQRVQDSADYMPPSQRNKVLASNLGADWQDLFSEFTETPMAAASIGQVHAAVLKANGERVAVKVQYPGVASSIDSDLSNLSILLTASRLLPKGLFLDRTIANARTELAWECDYVREADCASRFGELLADDATTFRVPKIYKEASGPQVLTMEFMEGVGVTRNLAPGKSATEIGHESTGLSSTTSSNLTQKEKDWIGTQILRLCLREITEFRFMQTDPNWTNFLYDRRTRTIALLDFGASRNYDASFIDAYTRLLLAASRGDVERIRAMSVQLGYLTGTDAESAAMVDAHVASVLCLAEPFATAATRARHSNLTDDPHATRSSAAHSVSEELDEVYDFSGQTITERVRALIPIMLRERRAPPPEETYSLHRKLSGAFLLCARLGARVRCRDLFEAAMRKGGYV